MKKIIAILTALLMLTAIFCGCAQTQPEETTLPVPETTEPTTVPPTLPEFQEQENPITYFYLSMGEDYENVRYMMVSSVEAERCQVEYVGQEKKVGDFETDIFHGVTEAFHSSGLEALHGKDVYEEGNANGSMYVEFADGTAAAVGFGGKIPEEFVKGYEKMDVFFQMLTAALPVYVPQPIVMGEVSEDLLGETMEILQGSGIEALDAFTVSQLPVDEYFAFSAGLSSEEGIADAVMVAPMMITTAYSLVIVRLEDTKKAEAICEDFEQNLDWRKWVCVAPSSAVIAMKGDMVLCLMTHEALDSGTPAGIRQAGWTEVKTLTNPDMQ